MWYGVLHHIAGEHEWLQGRCSHSALTQADLQDRTKQFITPGSPQYLALKTLFVIKSGSIHYASMSTAGKYEVGAKQNNKYIANITI